MLLRIWSAVTVNLLGAFFLICSLLISCKPNTPQYTSIIISSERSTINIEEKEQLTAFGTLKNGSVENITHLISWQSSSATITIAPNGVATGTKVGTSEIIATMSSLRSNVITIKVKNPLISITIMSKNSNIDINGTEKFVAVGTYYNKSKIPLTSIVNWKSSNSDIAAISSLTSELRQSGLEIGTAKGFREGTTEISAEFGDLKSNWINLNVINKGNNNDSDQTDQNKKLMFILINPTRAWIDVGDALPFEAIGRYGSRGSLDPSIRLNVKWESSDPYVAQISPTGVVIALTEGRTFISAKTDDIPYNLTPVFVGRAGLKYLLMEIDIAKPLNNTINKGQTFRLNTTGYYQDNFNMIMPASKLKWASSNTNVANVSSNGELTGLRPGRVTISTSLDEISNSFTLIVK